MSRTIAVSLFFILLFASLLGLSLSLAPGLSAKNAYLYIIIVMLLARAVIEHKAGGLLDQPIQLASMHVIFICLLVWGGGSWLYMTLLGTHVQYDPVRGFILLKGQIADLYIVFVAFFFSIRSKEDVLWAVKIILLMIAVYNSITILDAFGVIDMGLVDDLIEDKFWGPMGHSNEYGGFLTFFLPSFVVITLATQGGQRVIYAIGSAVTLILLVATLSRASYVGLIGGTLLTAFLFRSQIQVGKYVKNSIFVVAIVVVLVFVSGLWEHFYDRVVGTTGRASSVDAISSGRLGIWAEVLAKQLEMPITLISGVGWDTYKQSGWFNLSAHNTYLTYYFELGVAGVILYAAPVANAIRLAMAGSKSALTLERNLIMALTVGLCSVLIIFVFGNPGGPLLFIWAYTGLILKLVYLLGRERNVSSD